MWDSSDLAKACRGRPRTLQACLGRCKACRGRPRTLPSMPRSCKASLHILGSHNVLCNLWWKILFVIDQCNKNIYKSWDSWGCWNNWQVHISKFYNNKKFLINSIYYLTKCHLHNIFLKKKKFNNRNGQKHDPIQEIQKTHTKQFSWEDLSLKNIKTIANIKCIE